MKNDKHENKPASHCANCKWGMDLEHRYDQVHCINEDSAYADSDVESTGTCPLFEHSIIMSNEGPLNDGENYV